MSSSIDRCRDGPRDTIEYLNGSLLSDGSHLNICHINARSIPAHLSEISRILTNSNIDVCAVSESFLKPTSVASSFSVPGFDIIRNDRITSHASGGVLFYIREHLKYQVILQSEPNSAIEYLFVLLKFSAAKILLGVIYNPPPSINKINSIADTLRNLCAQYDHVILLGDFNINLLGSSNEKKRLTKLARSLHFEFLDLKPTCFSPISPNGSLIDLILVKNRPLVGVFGQKAVPGISEHDLVFLAYKVRVPKQPLKVKYIKNYAAVDQDTLLSQAHSLSWDGVYNEASSDLKLDVIYDNLDYLLNNCIPTKRILISPKNAPWYNLAIQNAEMEREMAYNLWYNSRDPEDRSVFCRLRNRVTTIKNYYKNRYFKAKFKSLENQPAKFYSTLKELTSTQSSSSNFQISSDELNRFFCSHSPNPVTIPLPDSENIHFSDIFNFKCIDSSELQRAILGVKSNAIGSDGFSRRFIHLLLPILFPHLLHLFNFIITSCSFPSKWKKAIIIPIAKCASPLSPTDFRPIGILCYLAKLLEFVLRHQMHNFLETRGLINPSQSGFRPLHSTTTALLKVSYDILKSLDSRSSTIHSLLDFSLAFDRLNHSLVLQKLYLFFRFSPLACQLLHSYLSNRSQSVLFNDVESALEAVLCGVIQGGLISTELFKVQVNDLPNVLEHCSCMAYADDTQIYKKVKHPPTSDDIDNFNTDLSNISRWSYQNGFTLNIAKTQIIEYWRNDRSALSPPTLDGTQLSFSSTVKNLGITFDHSLSWEPQINKVCGIIYGTLGKLRQIQHFLPISSRIRIIKTTVLPHVLYGSVLFWNANDSFIYNLRKAINSCTRFVFSIPYTERLGDRRDILLGMSLVNYLKFRAMLFLFNLITSKSPPYLYSLLSFSTSSRYPRNLTIPLSRSRGYHGSIFVSGASLWNSLPGNIKNSSSLDTFRKLAFDYFKNL